MKIVWYNEVMDEQQHDYAENVEMENSVKTGMDGGAVNNEVGGNIGGGAAGERGKSTENDAVGWVASEYVVQQRENLWYIGLILIGAGLTALAIWLKYWTFAVLIVVSVVALIVYVKRPPRKISYRLDREGLWEDEKRLHKYVDFKAFSVVQEQNNFSIVLTPKKRFGLSVRVYFPQDQGEKIVDMFGLKLPMKELKMDFLDKIVKFLRI